MKSDGCMFFELYKPLATAEKGRLPRIGIGYISIVFSYPLAIARQERSAFLSSRFHNPRFAPRLNTKNRSVADCPIGCKTAIRFINIVF